MPELQGPPDLLGLSWMCWGVPAMPHPGGSPSAAGGLRRCRGQQPGAAAAPPEPGLLRVRIAAPARAPPAARAPAPAPAPARARLHRGLAAPPSGPRAPARRPETPPPARALDARPFVRPARAPAYVHAHAHARSGPPSLSTRPGSAARGPPSPGRPVFRPCWVLAPASVPVPPPSPFLLIRSVPTRGRERGYRGLEGVCESVTCPDSLEP